MHVHASDFRSVTAAGLRRFYLLRIFRIYPLNTFVMLVLLVIVAASPGFVAWMRQVRGPDTFSAAGFVQYLLLAQRWLMPDFGEWNNAAWTVSVEILGYLFFPVLAYRLGRTQRAAVCLGIALASLGALFAIQILIGQADMNAIGRSSILRMAGSFTAGMALCRMAALAGPALAGQATRLTLVAAAFLLVVLLTPGLGVVAPLGFAALILGLAYGVGPIDRLLASRPVFWLGEISFSLYMIHSLPIDLASWLVVQGTLPASPALLLAAVAVSIVLAALTFHSHRDAVPAARPGHAAPAGGGGDGVTAAPRGRSGRMSLSRAGQCRLERWHLAWQPRAKIGAHGLHGLCQLGQQFGRRCGSSAAAASRAVRWRRYWRWPPSARGRPWPSRHRPPGPRASARDRWLPSTGRARPARARAGSSPSVNELRRSRSTGAGRASAWRSPGSRWQAMDQDRGSRTPGVRSRSAWAGSLRAAPHGSPPGSAPGPRHRRTG